MKEKGPFSALKLRASWGETGNDKIGAYPGVPIVTGNLNAVFGTGETLQYGASPIELANPQVKWEKTTQTDVGADMVLFNGQLEATLDYYHRLTDGILVQVPIPTYIGVSTQPYVNAAKVVNTGIEGSFVWRHKIGAADLDLRNITKARAQLDDAQLLVKSAADPAINAASLEQHARLAFRDAGERALV